MKVYPGRHQIMQVEKVDTNLDIPLAFIDTGYKDYVVSVLPKYSSDKMEPVVPYTAFDSLDVCLFDKNKNLVNNTSILQRDRDKYYYVPQNATTFEPQRFNYSAVGKKHMVYKNDKQYNVKAGCVDNDNLDFSKLLIKVFGDAPDRLICPANIAVNSKDVSIQSLTNSSVVENDFVFIKSPDGVHLADGTTEIDFDTFLSNHTNVWLSVDTFPYALQPISTRPDLKLKGPILYTNPTLMDSIFDASVLQNEDGIKFHNIFNDIFSGVYIKEVENKGFVIMTPANFLNNIEVNVKLFYEIMMYVYFNTYCESDAINDWITDIVPDYVVMNSKLIKKDKFTSSMEYYRLLGLTQSEVDLVDVKITPSNVKFNGIVNNYIVFKKDISGTNIQYADPAKPSGSMSVFTPRQNVMFYQDFVYNIEDKVQDKISWVLSNESLIFSVRPFVNTLNGINVTQEASLQFRLFKVVNYKEVKITDAIIYLVCKENILNLVPKETYTNTSGIIIAEIQISQSDNKSQIYDMRQRGGGYPDETEPPVQSLLDVGYLSGMAYRKAGTLIITLPKRLEQFEDLITKVVKKHMVAEEFPIILFEDKEE